MRLALALAALSAAPALAASVDVTSSYDMKAVSYSNLSLGTQPGNSNASLLENDARFGVKVQQIALPDASPDTTLDVGVLFHAIGVAGSSSTIAAPFDRAAAYYPSVNFTPFFENAYLRVNHLWGLPMDATLGRQSYKLGSGLLLDDNGAGFTGAVVRARLPWAQMKAEGFAFVDKDPNALGPSNNLMLYGGSLGLPTDGMWQLNELVEDEQGDSIDYGCSADPSLGYGCRISKAMRSFTSLRYSISYGDIFFDGEAALEKGSATPDGPTPAPGRITYNGNAEVARVKWKQPFYHTDSDGIAWMTLARGSGDKAGTATTDEAFYPTHGSQYDGLERTGFGDFYGATPYSALGGNYATTGSSVTRSGLPYGDSGITTVAMGYTFPSWRNVVLDGGYFLYMADQVASAAASRTLGMEWDVHLRYQIRDQLSLLAGMAYFRAGAATAASLGSAHKFTLEFNGRF